MTDAAVVLIAHGTVDSQDELPEFLANIRRGRPAPPEVLDEVRRRYEAIGGKSPLNAINRDLASKLEARLEVPVRLANRLCKPYPKDVLAELAALGARRIVALPLAQHSAPIYADAVREAAKDVPAIANVVAAPNWGRMPELTQAFARAIAKTFEDVPTNKREKTALVLTAHSLPTSVIEAGDPYESEVRASAEDVTAAVRRLTAYGERPPFAEHVVAFQSQGMTGGDKWLGPDLRATLEDLASRGHEHVVIAPIGFLADHVEILYDLDIEARSWGTELGIHSYRTGSLNADDAIVSALATIARGLLDR